MFKKSQPDYGGPLPPLSRQAGTNPAFIATRPQALLIKANFASLRGSYEVGRVVGPDAAQPFLTVQGEFSLRSRKKVMLAPESGGVGDGYGVGGGGGIDGGAGVVPGQGGDGLGRYLFDITKPIMHLHTTFELGPEGGEPFATVQNSLFKFIGSKATATFRDTKGEERTLIMEGSWLDRNNEIRDESGQIVARAHRTLVNVQTLVFGNDSYQVDVAPGADMVLVAAMCICLDIKHMENRGSS